MKIFFFFLLGAILITSTIGTPISTKNRHQPSFEQDRGKLKELIQPRFKSADVEGHNRINIYTDTLTGCKYISWWGGQDMTPLYISGGTIDCSGTKRIQTK